MQAELMERNGSFVMMDVGKGGYLRLQSNLIKQIAQEGGVPDMDYFWYSLHHEDLSMRSVNRDEHDRLEAIYQKLLKKETP